MKAKKTLETTDEPKRDIWTGRLTWEGIEIEVRYEADWLGCTPSTGTTMPTLSWRQSGRRGRGCR
jgi:hypothetical protein